MPIPVPIPFTISMCLPQECSRTDISTLVKMIPGLAIEPNPLVPDDPVSCQPYMDPPYHWTAIAMIFVCCLIAGMVVFSSLADLCIQLWRDGTIPRYLRFAHKSRTVSEVSDKTPLLGDSVSKRKRFDLLEWVQAFSLYKTIPTIFSTKQTSAAIKCVNGIRVLSILWVILCHTYVWVSYTTGADNIRAFVDGLKTILHAAN